MKKRAIVCLIMILLLMTIFLPESLSFAEEGLLPTLAETVGISMPSLGEALGRYPDEEEENEDGSVTELYMGVSEADFNAFSVYLEQQSAELINYKVENGILTAEIRAKGTSFNLNYNSRNGEARETYPVGTFDEWVKEAKSHFDLAQKLLAEGKADEAYKEIATIPQFYTYGPVGKLLKDNNAFAEAAAAAVAEYEAKLAPFMNVGSIVTFGVYPQTADGTDQTPIKWIILDYDDENNKSLLLSKYGLEAKSFNDKHKQTTWNKCTLRSWLNSTFFENAFGMEEQNVILTTTVDNSADQGYSGWDISGTNDSEDKVFLLSYREANRYLNVTYNKDNIKARVAPTAYALAQDARTNDSYKTEDGETVGVWWLRSPGMSTFYAGVINYVGSQKNHQTVDTGDILVRPALWLNLEWVKGEKKTFEELKKLLDGVKQYDMNKLEEKKDQSEKEKSPTANKQTALYKEPSDKSERICTIPKGLRLVVLDTSDENYTLVELRNGVKGYILTKYISFK